MLALRIHDYHGVLLKSMHARELYVLVIAKVSIDVSTWIVIAVYLLFLSFVTISRASMDPRKNARTREVDAK